MNESIICFKCRTCNKEFLSMMDGEFESGWAYCKECFEKMEDNHIKRDERNGPERLKQKKLL